MPTLKNKSSRRINCCLTHQGPALWVTQRLPLFIWEVRLNRDHQQCHQSQYCQPGCETQTQRHYRVFLRPPQHLHLTERTHMFAVGLPRLPKSFLPLLLYTAYKRHAIHEQFAPSGKLAFPFFSKKIWTDTECHNLYN